VRRSGVLLPIFSLPGPEPTGTFGQHALEFADFLVEAGFSLWQILPIPPEGVLESPYAGKSAFAIDPFLLSLEDLVDLGLLDRAEYQHALAQAPRAWRDDRVPWVEMRAWKGPVLDLAGRSVPDGVLAAWIEQNSWADDWALWSAISSQEEGRPWTRWPEELRDRKPDALARIRSEQASELRTAVVRQWLTAQVWTRFRAGLAERGVALLGDLPLYVAGDGADVWAFRDVFQLDATGVARMVAGVPPDPFATEGQGWGNPVFDWEHSERTGHAWWRARFRRALETSDLVRIDHFRGLEQYFTFPADGRPKDGHWNPGPGKPLFEALRLELASIRGIAAEKAGHLSLPIVAEDLGVITPEVEKLRDELEIPGMKVLQFAWDGDPNNPYFPPHIQGAHWLVVTGTHDLDSTNAWFDATFPWCRDNFERFVGHRCDDPATEMARIALHSVGDLAVLPYQDVLGLGAGVRLNVPGVCLPDNWSWRAPAPSPEVARRYRTFNEAAARTVR
jgi:4-alpha-glucanotransferase